MPEIEFTKEEKDILTDKIQAYFKDELDQDIGRFDAEFLLSFITVKIGVFFYNRGLNDAQVVLQSRFESITDAIYELEKPAEISR